MVARTLAGVALGALALSACGGPKYHYVKSSSDRTFVRLPERWTLFDEDELLETSNESPEAKAEFKRRSWSVAFDAAPRPSLDHLLTDARHPAGLVQVRELLPQQRDSFSLAELRTEVLGFDPLAAEVQEAGGVEVLEAEEVRRPGGYHGSELLVNLKTEAGELVKWRQVALVDSGVRKVHVLAIGCDTACYNANEDVIDKVISSWKVEDR